MPLALLVEGMPTIIRIETWGALLGIGLVATAFAFQVMYRLLPRIGATRFTTVTFIVPISAIVLGVGLLGEVILPNHLLGMLVIFSGLALIDGRIIRLLMRYFLARPRPRKLGR